MTITLTLPLPARGLRPNDRCHFMKKARLIKQAREMARKETFQKIKSLECEAWIMTGFTLHAYFSTKRWWDVLNIISSSKSYEDGIADAVDQNDKNFQIGETQRFTDTKNPRLEIILHIEELI